MEISSVKFDCRHFRGESPCIPNKLKNKKCTCDEYQPVTHKILIIKLGAAGDVIRTTPLLRSYRKLYPQAHITWLTHSPEILPRDGSIDKIRTFKFHSVFPLLHQNFDIAINLDKDKEACILLSRITSKSKFGFISSDGHIAGLNEAANRKIITGLFDDESKNNTLSYQQEIFEICNMKYEGEEPMLHLDEGLFNYWYKLAEQAGERKIIGLNTGCGKRWRTRLWQYGYWRELISLLVNNNYYPVLLGGTGEDAQNKSLSKDTQVYYPGTFKVEEFIAITAHCDLVVTAVSMMMHIAMGLEKPVVLFNNIFNKHEFEMYGRGAILEPETGCDCYYGTICTRQRHCMKDLLPTTVFQAIKTFV